MSDEAASRALTSFLEGYLKAWTSNRPEDIRAIFTEDARYFTDPWTDPWAGADQIVEQWIKRDDQPGTWTFEWSPLVVTDEVSVVQGVTKYTEGRTYSNLWVIRLGPDGRAREFTEWWIDQADPS
jgi:hypothetical protein